MKVPLFKPSITKEEIEEVVDTLKSGWIGLGPKVIRFEKEFARYIGAKYAIATSSGTVALKIALKALDIKKKEVITTPLTFVSTPHIVVHLNKRPVFADVRRETLNLDPLSVTKNLSKKTGAILPVHYGGQPCQIDELNKIAKENNLKILYDSAHASGAEYKGKKIGSSNLSCFSFHAVKNLTTGDGGMITTNDYELSEKMRKLRWMGISKSTYERDLKKYQWKYRVDYFGYKGYMNDIAASLGLVQLKRLDELNLKRRKIVEEYNKAFEDLKGIETPKEKKNVKSSWHLYVIRLKKREKLRIFLAKKGITTGVHYLPAYNFSVYSSGNYNCPVTNEVWKTLLTLPLYPDMSKEELEYVIEMVKEAPFR